MAETDRTRAADALLSYLVDNARRVAFFQALLMLERVYPESVPVGHEGPASQERLRLKASPAMSCPPADLKQISDSKDSGRVEVTATFLGLFGADTPLPPTFAEHIAGIALEPSGERVRDFLDVFHHRMYSLLFRGWKKSRPVGTGKTDLSPVYDRLLSATGYSGKLGLGGPTMPRLAESRLKVLRARTASGLEEFLRLRMGVPCTVRQLLPRMAVIPTDQRSQLGQRNCRLGADLIAGTRIGDRNKICLQLRADDRGHWANLAPKGRARQELGRAVNDYLNEPVDRDVEVSMGASHVSAPQLGSRNAAIGRDSWLGRPRPEARWRWRSQLVIE